MSSTLKMDLVYGFCTQAWRFALQSMKICSAEYGDSLGRALLICGLPPNMDCHPFAWFSGCDPWWIDNPYNLVYGFHTQARRFARQSMKIRLAEHYWLAGFIPKHGLPSICLIVGCHPWWIHHPRVWFEGCHPFDWLKGLPPNMEDLKRGALIASVTFLQHCRASSTFPKPCWLFFLVSLHSLLLCFFFLLQPHGCLFSKPLSPCRLFFSPTFLQHLLLSSSFFFFFLPLYVHVFYRQKMNSSWGSTFAKWAVSLLNGVAKK